MKTLIISLINFYQQFLSFDTGILRVFAPGGACRYNVSCSEYTKRMVMEYGVIKGVTLGAKRVWSCK